MKKLLVALFCIVALSSCQKEFSINDPNNNGSNGGTGTPPSGGSDGTYLLYGYNVNEHNDTNYAYYAYDSLNRIKEYGYKGKDDSIYFNQTLKLVRDADGRITDVNKEMDLGAMVAAANLSSMGIPMDSIIKTHMTVHYPAGSNNFDFTVEGFDIWGMIIITTIKYEYSNNRVFRWSSYISTSMFGTVMQTNELTAKQEYTYSAEGNISTVKIYGQDPTNPSGTLKLMSTRTVTCNDKKNFVPANNEGFLYNQEYNSNVNLVVGNSLFDNYYNSQSADLRYYDIAYNSQGLMKAANMNMVAYNQGKSPTVKKYKSTYYYK